MRSDIKRDVIPMITMDVISSAVSKVYKIPEEKLHGSIMDPVVSEAKGVFVLLTQMKTNHGPTDIVRRFGWRTLHIPSYHRKKLLDVTSRNRFFINRLEKVVKLIG